MYKSKVSINKRFLGQLLVWFFIMICFFDLIYPSKGENINRTLPVVGRSLFMLICLFYVFSTKLVSRVNIKRTITGSSFGALGLLFVCGSFVINPISLLENFTYLIKILYWIFGFFFFYYALYRKIINEDQLKKIGAIAVLIYFLVIIRDFINIDLWRGSKEYFVSNNSYILLKLTPLVLLIKTKFKNILLLIISLGIILSFKRGAILAIFIILAVYFYFEIKKSNKLFGILMLALVISVSYYAFSYNIDVIISRLSDLDNLDSFGSGRGKMFTLIINDMIYQNFNFIKLLFGNGFLSTVNFFDIQIGHPILAHSDFFEFFFDFGLVGLFIYFFSIFRLYRLYSFFRHSEYRISLLSLLIIIMLSAVYSINFFTPEMIYLMIPVAILEFKRIKILTTNN